MSSNCNPFGQCQEYEGSSENVVVKDHRSSPEYRVSNKSRHYFVKIRVDGCLIAEELGVRKCDYLLLDCTASKVYFIELKGQNLKDAVKQIKDTINRLGLQLDEFSFYGRIVQSRVIKATQQQHKADLIQFMKSAFPKNTKDTKALVRIESQKLIELI